MNCYPRSLRPSLQWTARSVRRPLYWVLIGVGLSFGCGRGGQLKPIRSTLEPPQLKLGFSSRGEQATDYKGRVGREAGAQIHESIESVIHTKGSSPITLKISASGRWNENAEFKPMRSKIQPSAGMLASALRGRLAESRTPPEYPLEPLRLMIGKSIGETPRSIDIKRTTSSASGSANLSGRWSCTRAEGLARNGWSARRLDCTIEDGKAVQEGKGPHEGTTVEATLLGRLRILWVSGSSGLIAAEEIQLKLYVGTDEVSPMRLKTSYQRVWCRDDIACTGLK